jgi:hypothetical protein
MRLSFGAAAQLFVGFMLLSLVNQCTAQHSRAPSITHSWKFVVCAVAFPYDANNNLESLWYLVFVQFRSCHESVTDVHDVTGLIHGHCCRDNASCVYLESFSFSLLCTIEYTHTVLPNFHIVIESELNRVSESI